MRVLIVSAPLIGHVFPLVPLAVALRDAEHGVLGATAAEGLDVARSGLPVRDVAPAFDFGRIARGRCCVIRCWPAPNWPAGAAPGAPGPSPAR
ncbi:hypothetical protein [Micromonospora sp. C28ISP2-4]|uniref:hypothetical protein n=1 Tax=Micromonospora sp. C28ISP2-4 TaxID=3059523 RepID=UPI002676271B|nr:hypothetical protein [Micromonospora sp. C28ISP2-4]MDO3685487.1 hypothetical protein [Micromonospora sp. C28ISP2-4]